MATLRGSYGNSEGPVFNRGGLGSVRDFPCKFPHKMPLVTCPCAFRLCRLAQNDVPAGVRGHFSCKFPYKMALVKCPCACRRRRRAQNETPRTELLPRGRSSRDLAQSPLIEILFRDLAQNFDCAGSRKMLAAGLASGIFPVNFRTKCFW